MNDFNFKFKADRTYLHGTDVFNKVSAELKESIQDISFRNTTDKQCYLSSERGDNVVAIIKTVSQSIYLVESNEHIKGRYDFDEDGLVTDSIINGNRISMSLNEQYTFIENIVALTKKLNNVLDRPRSGKWLFGQYKSKYNCSDFTGMLEIESSKRIKSKFSENLIYLDGKLKAKIMFIVGDV